MAADVMPSLRALLGGSVDYAGLFPPAALALEPALVSHAAYVRSGDAWMLGCFVLPVAKLAEAGRLLAGRFDAENPLRISVLGPKTASGGEFLDDLREALRGLANFEAAHGRAVIVDQFEMPMPPDAAPSPLLREAAGIFAGRSLRAFWEIPFANDLPTRLHSISEHRSFGAKLRTGGLEAAAFPSTAQLPGALIAARDAKVALKFTAGLHHPFRRFDAGVGTRMHGFVNVFATGVLLRERQVDAAGAQDVLEDEDPASFRFDADGLRWRDQHVTTEALCEARPFITSFGSCSFDEPRDDLRAAGLLP